MVRRIQRYAWFNSGYMHCVSLRSSGGSPYSALCLVQQRIHALRQSTELCGSPHSALCLVQQRIQVHRQFTLCSLSLFTGPDALHQGRYGQKYSYALGRCCTRRFCWCFCTSRCALFLGWHAHDARHHGRYGQKDSFALIPCSGIARLVLPVTMHLALCLLG